MAQSDHREATSLRCSNCGAQLRIGSARDEFVTCDYCGSTYKVADLLGENGLDLSWLEDQIRRASEQVQQHAGRWKGASRPKLSRGSIAFLVILALIVPLLLTVSAAVFDDDMPLAGIIALVQVALLVGAFIQTLKSRGKTGMRGRTLMVVLAAVLVVPWFAAFEAQLGSTYTSDREYTAYSWDDLVLGSELPVFDRDTAYISRNSASNLDLDFPDVDDAVYRDYIAACQAAGYTVEQEYSESSFTAFDEDGYRLEVYLYTHNGEMDLTLEAPKPMSKLVWPSNTVAGLLPVPDADEAYIESAGRSNFSAYIGGMSRDDVNAYIQQCVDSGFTEEKSQSDGILWAENADGASLTIRYVGNNVMSVYLYSYDD
ncbi:MAG: DUF6591 domain-containing protein [Olegusella sp.]|nr:DUF6591 domain-containing protein [Olegusella sp.]